MKKQEKIRIFIVDDDETYIKGISEHLKDSKSFDYIGSSTNGKECIEMLITVIHLIDIILMDVNFKKLKLEGFEIARRIRAIFPGKYPRIVFLSTNDNALVNIEQGFHGLISKNTSIVEMERRMTELHFQGTIFYPPKPKIHNLISNLTERQKEIFHLTLRIKSNAEISSILGIRESTLTIQQKAITSKIRQIGIEIKNLHDSNLSILINSNKIGEASE